MATKTYIVTSTAGANLRQCPSTSYPTTTPAGYKACGEAVEVIADWEMTNTVGSETKYLPVLVDGEVLYCAAGLLTAAEEMEETEMSDCINAAGLALVKKYEGLELTAYQCAAGVWTIGYGHTGTVDGQAIKKGMTITKTKAEALLVADLAAFWRYVNQASYVPVVASLNDNQKSALCSFAFNCGENNLKTLCANRTVSEIADALLLYNKAGGKVLAGLVDRRKAERELYLTGSTTTTESEEHNMDTLRNGDKGQQVQALQKLLGCGLAVDGIFGAKTEAAVKEYQQAKGLTVDGIVGANTWGKLLAA